MHIHRKLFIEKTSHNNYSHMFEVRAEVDGKIFPAS